ncbi:MAG: ABC transporter permease [Pseudohongiellaceae bacterium]
MLSHFTRMAFKALLRFKLHTAISLLSLVIGFTCFVSALLISNYSQSFDRGFPNSDRIYNIIIRAVGDSPLPDRFPIVNEPTARYLRTAFPEIPNIVKASPGFPQTVVVEDQSMALNSKFIEDRFFDIFPMETLHGLSTGEPLPPNSVMLTETGARKLFGRTDVVGERLMIDNQWDVVVAGVTRTLPFPSHIETPVSLFNTELFIPMALREQSIRESRIAEGVDPDADRWGNQSNFVYLEIPEGLPFDETEFNDRLDEFVQTYMPEDRAAIQSFDLLPNRDLIATQMAFITGGFSLPSILIVAGALVLLIGCLNYSNLVIAQLSLRSQEIGVQKILGSRRSLLLLQYCYEALLFMGIALGMTLTILGVALQVLSASAVGVGPGMLLDPSLWIWLVLVMVVIVAIAGGYPALRTAWVPLVQMMRPKGSSGYSGRLRGVMVGVQFFISGTLMILAVVMFTQNRAMTQQLDANSGDVKIAIMVNTDNYSVDPELLINELQQDPSVLSATQVDTPPWEISNSSNSYTRSRDVNATSFELSRHFVGYDYTETMGQQITVGREFERGRSSDLVPPLSTLNSASGPYSVIINDQAARSMGWENAADALGEAIYLEVGPPTTPNDFYLELDIVGGMDEQKYQFIDFASFGSEGDIYILRPDEAPYLIVRVARASLNNALQHIESTWTRLMPEIPLRREFVDDLFYESYGMFLTVSVSIGALSVFGFFVASIGLLGNATFITNIRRKEVGIRKVMGASSGTLLRMLLLDFAKPILIANALAWPLGYVLARGYTNLFAADININIWPFLISLGLSALIAFLAVFSQSWKSARVRPAMVLRYE